MHTVSSIVKSPAARNYLDKFLNIQMIFNRTYRPLKARENKSSSLSGLVIEQLILVDAYKSGKNRSILKSIEDHIDRIKSLKNEINATSYSLPVETWSDNRKNLLISYRDLATLNSNTYYVFFKSVKIKFKSIKPYNFIKESTDYKFLYAKTGFETYILDFPVFQRFTNKCIDILMKKVYSKETMSTKDIVKLLIFENLLFNLPVYLTGSTILYSQNITKIFLDYDVQVESICKLFEANKVLIKKLGKILTYQSSCSYKEIRGRIDFTTSKSMIDIKSGSKPILKDIYQAILYILISNTKEGKAFKKVQKMEILYLNSCEKFSVDCCAVIENLTKRPEYVLNGLISLMQNVK